MLSILVCHSYFLRFDQKQRERAKPYPPLATLQVASMLRKAGHEVSLFDAMLAEDLTRFERQLDALQPQVVLFYEDNYNFLSKMCLGRCGAPLRNDRAGASARRAVVAAGSDASDAPDKYLAAGADAVLHGEGLATLMRCSTGWTTTLRWRDGHRRRTARRECRRANRDRCARAGSRRCPNPTHVALPAWDLVDIEKYRRVWRARMATSA